MIDARSWRLPVLLVLAMLGRLLPAAAQDLVAVVPELAKVEYEDARVRVVRLHIPERASLPMHDRPRRVVISLTASQVQLTRADGTVRETHTEAGSFAWSESTVRSVRNFGGALENIVVELKQADLPAVSVAHPPAVPPARYLNDVWHRWALENQYVRVYDVRIPPGETTGFHRHAFDQVAIHVSGGLSSEQLEGKPWGQARMMEPGSVAFAGGAATPITHRLRNDGRSECHIVLVQFLQ